MLKYTRQPLSCRTVHLRRSAFSKSTVIPVKCTILTTDRHAKLCSKACKNPNPKTRQKYFLEYITTLLFSLSNIHLRSCWWHKTSKYHLIIRKKGEELIVVLLYLFCICSLEILSRREGHLAEAKIKHVGYENKQNQYTTDLFNL